MSKPLVNSEYITGLGAFSDRTDVRTLRPMLEKLSQRHQARYEEGGGCGFAKPGGTICIWSATAMCFIKPANYEQKRTRKFQSRWARIENMKYEPEEDSFTCAQGRKLYLRRGDNEVQDGQLVSTAWYRCEDCSGCPPRRSAAGPRIRTGPRARSQKTFWEEAREQAARNILTERGLHLRLFAALFRWRAPLVC